MADQILDEVTVTATREEPPPPDYVRYPRCRIIVRHGEGDPVAGVAKPIDGLDITSFVTRVRTSKSLGSPCGTFEIGLVFKTVRDIERAGLHQVLTHDNLLSIELDRGLKDSTFERVMDGWISEIRTTQTVTGPGRVQRGVVVGGFDAGKFLVRHDIAVHNLTAYLHGTLEAERRDDVGAAFGGTVGECLRPIFQYLFGKVIPRPRPVERSVGLLTHPGLEREGTPGRTAEALPSQTTGQVWFASGKFWTIFRSYLDEPWNQAWTDYLTPAKAALYAKVPYVVTTTKTSSAGHASATPAEGFYIVARPLPFGETEWRALPTTTVFDSEIIGEDLRLSDDERVNLTYVTGLGMQAASDVVSDFSTLATLHANNQSMQRHGAQTMSVETIYHDVGAGYRAPAEQRAAAHGDTTQNVALALQMRGRRLWDYFSVNHQLTKGALVMIGHPGIRIGERVRNQSSASARFVGTESERQMFFVEQVVQDFVEGSHFRTHLALTRGAPLAKGGLVQPVEPTTAAKFIDAQGAAQ